MFPSLKYREMNIKLSALSELELLPYPVIYLIHSVIYLMHNAKQGHIETINQLYPYYHV